ncbi:MAG: hypothetical protein GXO93_05715, partial [FCB group bacterium]|nr:hypothetical protein [FCB group bacterium]
MLVKYDRVKMYDVRSNWAYVENIDTYSNKTVSGWAARKYLRPWKSAKFFKVKDNIFKLKKKPVALYNNGLKGTKVGTLPAREKIRVLRGNGVRFFVVTKSGKSGWVNPGAIDTKKLVAKSFSFEKKIEKKLPVSKSYTNKK